MEFVLVYAALAIIFTALASYFDLKTRIIPREITYSLLGLALVLHFLEAGIKHDPWIFFSSVTAAVISYLAMYAFWRLGAIAGGDAKLLVGLSAMFPQIPRTFDLVNQWHLTFLPIIWNGILLIIPPLLVYIAFARRKELVGILIRNTKSALGYSFLIYSVFNFYSGITAWAIFLVLSFLPEKWLVLAIPGIFTGFRFGFLGLAKTFLFLFLFSVYFDLFLGSRSIFKKREKVSNLKEGMILGEIICKSGKFPFGDCIFPKSRGLTREEIDKIKSWGFKEVLVQKAIPFTPIILLGLIVSIFLGDLIWLGVR